MNKFLLLFLTLSANAQSITRIAVDKTPPATPAIAYQGTQLTSWWSPATCYSVTLEFVLDTPGTIAVEHNANISGAKPWPDGSQGGQGMNWERLGDTLNATSGTNRVTLSAPAWETQYFRLRILK